MEEEANKDRWLNVRLSEGELQQIQRAFAGSTCRKLSEYARKKLLDQPLTVYYRNRSLDDFMTELMKLRSDLNAVGNNYNQMVKRLHQLQHGGDISAWIVAYEKDRVAIQQKVESIKKGMEKFGKIWLQSSRQERR